MKILSLDVASTTGWAISNEIYGTWDFKTLKDESMGMKLIRFKAKLNEVHKAEGLEIIIYERPAGQHAASVIHQSKLIAILENWCEENGVEYRAFSAKEIKKFGTGNGNANKKLMIDEAKKRYGYVGDDDNEADSLHQLNLFKHELGIK